MKEPESMDELVYFTNRTLGEDNAGTVRAWVFKQKCPKCGKALMGKPVEKGKVKIRAKEYKCPACGYTAEKQAYEETLTCSVQYTCPKCKKKGEMEVPYKRRPIEGIPTIRVQCQFCKQNIDITKKMREKGQSDDA
jgi:predicted RNA-binding Zn-ribbon protein involved in translation (DUF1610 family)